MSKTPIDLYSMAYQDRSDRVRWLLEEMNVSYTNKFLKKNQGEMNTPEYRKLNPMGRVPTIVDDGLVLHESAAICLYLADKYSLGKLAPHYQDEKLRAEYTKWMVFSVASLECVIARMFTHMNTAEEESITRQFVSEQCEIMSQVLIPILSRQDYILSSGFSAADIMLGAVIPGASEYLMDQHPSINQYMKRLMSREAAIKAKVFT